MIGLGLRLTLSGGKEAAVRLAVTAAAVALGVGMLLITLAGINALNAQNARAAWLNTGAPGSGQRGPRAQLPGADAAAPDPLWWLLGADQYGHLVIDRVEVAATGPSSPVPPGIPRLPGPGQFYASPALSQLLRSTPAAELGGRFPGRQIGVIGPPALPSPDALIIVIGLRAGQLARMPGAQQVASIQATPVSNGNGPDSPGYSPASLEFILAVGALALLFPVLVFIGTATRLSAARREQRFAAIRLVGAAPRQVSVISAVEASIAALAGVAIGFGLFYLLHPALADVPLTGQRFFPGDLSLGLADILLVAIGVPAAAAAAARVALRRVRISPLGVSRRVTPPAPRAYRMIPLLAGIGWLAAMVVTGHPTSTSDQIWAYLPAFFVIMSGLVIAGPWIIMAGARVVARRASRPALLIAGRRLSDNPRAAFRSISGLILALFVTSVSVGIITASVADQAARHGGATANDTLVDQLNPFSTVNSVPPITSSALARLRSTRGVQGVTVIRTDPLARPNENQADWIGLASCAQISRTPGIGRCAAGADVATIMPFHGSGGTGGYSSATVWPAAGISPGRLDRLRVQVIAVATNGSGAAIERARTALEVAIPSLGPPVVISDSNGQGQDIAQLLHMTDVVVLASLVIAGCSLAVSVTAGVSERKRPFSLLRLTGVSLGVLRRVVALEAAIPLLVIALVSTGAGFLASELFLRSELGLSLRPPGAAYYAVVLAGLVISLGVIGSTLPLLERITGPETARNE